MSKIETGCLAMVIRSKAGNEGKVVTVGKYIGEVKGFEGKDHWVVDRMLNTVNKIQANHIPESFLMRIDDYKETEQEIINETVVI